MWVYPAQVRRAFSAGTALSVVLCATAALAQSEPSAPPVTAPSPTATTANAPRNDQQQPAVEGDDSTPAADIVVTGSSIRGVPPTGSNLIQLGAEAVRLTGANTTQQLLATIPQLGTFNTAPRPDPGSGGILSTAPNIRGIGQEQTLDLINGHRFVGAGHLQNISDPSIIPPTAIDRVEVIADGASSVYGSDAISGVVNVITRRDYDGALTTFRYGVGSDYHSIDGAGIVGKKWSGGGFMVTAEYAGNSRLSGLDRGYVHNNFSGEGGTDYRVPYCANPNIISGGVNYATPGLQPNTRNLCDNSRYSDLYPKQQRLSVFSAGHQDITDNAEIYYDAFYSKTKSNAEIGPLQPSTATITTASPFFQAIPGSTATTEQVQFNLMPLLGPIYDRQSIQTYGGTIGVGVNIFHNFKWTTYVTGSKSITKLYEGSYNPTAYSNALIGTSTTTALDPFGGRTNPAVLQQIGDYTQFFGSHQSLYELNSKVDGPLFSIPGGDVKVAAGGVFRREFYSGQNALTPYGQLQNLGAQTGVRKVYSGFGELFVPFFSDKNGVTGLQRLDLSLSARYDSYSDFGNTFNPKVGVNWAPIRGFTLRGSWSTSFHAPALPDLYGPDTRAGYIPTSTVGSTVYQGYIYLAGGNPNLTAEKAHNWSLGADIAPVSLPGLRASLTYYNIDFKGRIAYPSPSFFFVDPAYNVYITNNVVNGVPQNIDPATVAAILGNLRRQNFPSATATPPIQLIYNLLRRNLAEIMTDGIDFDVSYHWAMPFGQLQAEVQGNRTLRYDQSAVPGATFVDQFNYGVIKFKARASLALTSGPFQGSVMVNYDDKYRNPYFPLGSTVASTETIKSFTTVDFHLGYTLPDRGVLSGTELTLDVQNAFDQDPPEMRSGNGVGIGDVLGRVATFGIRKKF